MNTLTMHYNANQHCPWGNQDKLECQLFAGFSYINAAFSQPSADLTICQLNMVSLNKNLSKLEDFLNKFVKELEISISGCIP